MNPTDTIIDVEAARKVVRSGGAVVLPSPAPLTHVIVARSPETVNLAKGRPAAQPVALWSNQQPAFFAVEQVTDVSCATADRALRLLIAERVTMLVPLRGSSVLPSWINPTQPRDWMRPAIVDGWMMLYGSQWEPVVPLLDDHKVLYVSSANQTGQAPAASTAEARAMFPESIPVVAVDEPAAEDPAPRQATTTVRLHRDGGYEIHRSGAQDAADPDYLAHLNRHYGR